MDISRERNSTILDVLFHNITNGVRRHPGDVFSSRSPSLSPPTSTVMDDLLPDLMSPSAINPITDSPPPDRGFDPTTTVLHGEVNATATNVGSEQCYYLDFQYDITMVVICGLYLVFGVIYSLFGYRCFKAVMFLTGFIFGFVIVYLICAEETLLPQYGNEGVSLGAGLLFGLITMLVQYVGLFMTGLHTGVLLGLVGLVIAQEVGQFQPTIWVVVAVLLCSGLVMSLANLYWHKSMTIFGTSLYGGAIMTASMDYFIEKFRMVFWFWDHIRLTVQKGELVTQCWYGWLILGLWPFMLVVGCICQARLTGMGVFHEEVRPTRSKGRNVNLQRIRTREERAEAKQKQYRYLYQVRTAHGDVISQNYLQGLQHRKTTAQLHVTDTSTLNSDTTHLTTLASDHPQLTPLTQALREDSASEHGA